MPSLRHGAVAGLLAVVLGSTLGPAGPSSARAEHDTTRLTLPAASATLPGDWVQRFVVHYGAGERLLGTAPGGDSGNLDIGPEYGAPGPDGSWWFLDAAKRRLAHYDPSGRFLGRVLVPRRMLVNGVYFQWQLPHVLADGTLVAARQTTHGTRLLRLRHGVLDEIAVRGDVFPTYDDGHRLYGFNDLNHTVVIDPRTGAVHRTSTYRTPSGRRFSISVGRRGLGIDPPRGPAETVPVRTASGARARFGVQVRVGSDDTLHVFLTGTGADDDATQLVGGTSVSPSGAVRPIEALPNPFSEADPGSPAELEIAPGGSEPFLVYVLPDGVHVYQQTP